MKTKKYKPNWLGFLVIFTYSSIFALIGIGLVPVVLAVNNYHVSYLYAKWVSYFVSILLAYLFLYGIKLTEERK